MSTKKDVGKSTSTRKASTSLSKINAKTLADSVDRKKSEKMEIPIRNKVTSVEHKTSKNKEVESDVKSKVPKSSSRTSIDPKVAHDSPENADSANNVNGLVSGRSDKVAVSKNKLSSDGRKTTSGSKISKTQFFPSRNMYSNALKDKDESFTKRADDNVKMRPEIETISSRKPMKHTRETVPPKKVSSKADELKAPRSVSTPRSLINSSTRTPREKITTRSSLSDLRKSGPSATIPRSKHIKEPSSLESNKSPYTSLDASSSSERPRTATLRKGSIVNANIVGPDAPKTAKQSKTTEHVKSPTPRSEEEVCYEEDFDSYESDFEQYSSSSSNAENISSEETSSVTSSSDRELGPSELISGRKKVLSVGTDEERKMDSGNFDMSDYKHKQILDNIKEYVEKENTNLMLNNNPASLSDEGFEEQKSLQMINFLDAKKKYEHRRSVEMKKKRGDDILSMIRLDTYSFTLFDLPPLPYDVFIKRYGSNSTVQVSVQTGEDDVDENTQTEEIDVSTKWTQAPVAFSDIAEDDPQFWQKYKCDFHGVGNESYEGYKVDQRFNEHSLDNFFTSAGNLILRILEESGNENTCKLERNSRAIPFSDGYISLNTSGDIFKNTTVTYITFSCDIRGRIMTLHSKKSDGDNLLAVWRIGDPEQPEVVYSSHGVSCCSFGPEALGLVFAGLSSGALTVWNTKQKKNASADFCTDIGFGHESKIIGLQANRDVFEPSSDETNRTNEICSLDENGDLILWTVIMKNSTTNSAATSALLVLNSRVSLQKSYPNLVGLQCTDFAIDHLNTNIAFISTNYGFIIHHLIKGGKSNIKMFLPDSRSVANCLGVCQFSPNYFLAGHQNGDINLYSHLVEKPLMVFADKESNIHQCGVELIQWSRNKPFVIYTKDKSNRIHIWDLSESDMHPIYSVPIEDNITCMKLSSLYLVIGTEGGLVHLHQLNEEHAQQTKKVFDEQVKMFFNYVSRL